MDKRRIVRGRIPEKYKSCPQKYYVKYTISEQKNKDNKTSYELTARYFMSAGNVLCDSKILRTEKIQLYTYADVEVTISSINKNISATKNKMIKELKHISASPYNIASIMKQRGF